jgi:curli production assembly/transport component CsgG
LIKPFIALLLIGSISACGIVPQEVTSQPPVVVTSDNREFSTLPPPRNGRIVVAVYRFDDKTGQRRPSDRVAHMSTAVTQGAESWVITALRDVGGGTWFRVVERVGLENLARERQIIRQSRESVEDNTPIPPMLFAGMIVEGSIVGYDSNVLTGGIGARYLGIGTTTQYREDIVTITMRAVSVQTGEVLTSVAVTKNIVSHSDNLGVFRFVDMGTRALELEAGNSRNEPVTYAVRSAIEQAVVEMIHEGVRLRLWSFR